MNKKWWILFGFLIILTVVLSIVLPIVLINSSSTSNPSANMPTQSFVPPFDNILGLCYDPGLFEPNTDPQKMTECVTSDFQQIKAAGYNSVRTYFPIYGFQQCIQGVNNPGNYAQVAHNVGITVMLGVQQNLYDTYKECIVQQVENYPGTVVGVAIGNESVQDNNWNIGDIIIAHAQDLRKTLADKNIVVPVGTVQQSGFGLCSFANICTPLCPQSCKDIYRKMLANLDFIAFNVYPSTPTGGPAIASNDATFNKNSTYSQFDSLFRYVFQGKLWIGECGMPHEGSCKAGNGDVQTFTRTLQSTLVQDIKMWSSTHTKVPLYIFMAFDVPSKPDTPACAPLPSGEKTFGVLQNQECPRISL